MNISCFTSFALKCSCDETNTFTSLLCKFQPPITPSLWSATAKSGFSEYFVYCYVLSDIYLVLSDYELLGKKVSEKDLMLQYRSRTADDRIYGAFLKKDQAYDIYEKDIAVVHVYFESPTVIEFQKQQTMTEYKHNMHQIIYTIDFKFLK